MEEYSFIEEIDGDKYVKSVEDGRYIGIEGIFEIFVDANTDAAEVADIYGIQEEDVRNAIFYWTEEEGVYEELVESTGVSPGDLENVNDTKGTEDPGDDLEVVNGYDHLIRNTVDELLLRNYERSTESGSFNESADIIFSDLYERGKDPEEVAEETQLQEEQVREVRSYAEEKVENLHELARTAHEKRKIIEDASGEGVEDMMDRTLDEGGELTHIQYQGVLGELQELVEEEVDERGFKMRYDPDEEQQHRAEMEVHVLPDAESREELYFGMDDDGIFLGSTASEIDKTVQDVDRARDFVRQELNTVALADR